MGVYARRHAQQLILDSAPRGEKSPLSPRAQLLLLHTAQNHAGNEIDYRKKNNTGRLWDENALYYEGLGRKAQAMGYNVPDRIDSGTVQRGEMDTAQVNAVKAAVNKAIKELVGHGFLEQVQRGQTGQNATYSLRYLNFSCSICRHAGGMDQTLHDPAGRAAAEEDHWPTPTAMPPVRDPWDAGKTPSSWR